MTELSAPCIAALQHYARDRAGSINGKMGVPYTREAMERYFGYWHPPRDFGAWPDMHKILRRFGYDERGYRDAREVCLEAIGGGDGA